MTITLELTPLEADALTRKATAQGQRLPEYLQERVKEIATEESPIGAQIIAQWEHEGVIGYRTDITDSQEHARRIREKAQTRESE